MFLHAFKMRSILPFDEFDFNIRRVDGERDLKLVGEAGEFLFDGILFAQFEPDVADIAARRFGTHPRIVEESME